MNGIRGEASLDIAGTPHTLCLTLGALAELETQLGCRSLGELQARLRALSASEITGVLEALLRGGGNPVTAGELARQPIRPADAARSIAEAFRAALG